MRKLFIPVAIAFLSGCCAKSEILDTYCLKSKPISGYCYEINDKCPQLDREELLKQIRAHNADWIKTCDEEDDENGL